MTPESTTELTDASLVGSSDLLGSSLPVFKSNLSQDEREEKRAMLRRQIQYLITAPPEQQIRITCCACSQRAVVWMMYRCLYCGLFYCKSCAEIHFGQRKPTFDEDLPNYRGQARREQPRT